MRCPKCKGEYLEIVSTQIFLLRPEGAWDVDTPFEFGLEDGASCIACDWAGIFADLEKGE